VVYAPPGWVLGPYKSAARHPDFYSGYLGSSPSGGTDNGAHVPRFRVCASWIFIAGRAVRQKDIVGPVSIK
jgi:hypothetical protein